VDLNLLVALDALLDTGSVAKAAQRMHLSAPAMSRALTRLREATGDPLFVRAGRGLVPTPRALALRGRVRDALHSAEGLLRPEPAVDPRAFDRVLTIRANDSVIASLGSELLALVRREAPGLVLRFVVEGDEDVSELRDGRVDLDIGVQDALGPEIRVRSLYRDPLVVLVRAKHRGRMTLARLAAADHVMISHEGKLRTELDDLMAAHGAPRRTVAVVPNGLAAATLVAQSEVVCVMSSRFAAAMTALLPVKSVPLPLPGRPVPIALAWHPRFDHDPPHRWLRRAIDAIVRTGDA